ncbi:MAG: TIGR00296 family protein [Nitrososphaerales archaeon]
MPLSLEDGRLAVVLAREALECHVNGRKMPTRNLDSGQFSEARGVFVTLNTTTPTRNNLRGCIGFPYPVKRLGDAIREASIAAASEDPRFPPVGREELGSIIVEVSVLTPPRDIDVPRREMPSRVRIGKDGLMVSQSYASGLLLPQVATEFGMDQVEFLSQACIKAGLPPDAWLDPATRVQVFQAEIFAEKRPRGEVVRVAGEGP